MGKRPWSGFCGYPVFERVSGVVRQGFGEAAQQRHRPNEALASKSTIVEKRKRNWWQKSRAGRVLDTAATDGDQHQQGCAGGAGGAGGADVVMRTLAFLCGLETRPSVTAQQCGRWESQSQRANAQFVASCCGQTIGIWEAHLPERDASTWTRQLHGPVSDQEYQTRNIRPGNISKYLSLYDSLSLSLSLSLSPFISLFLRLRPSLATRWRSLGDCRSCAARGSSGYDRDSRIFRSSDQRALETQC